MAGLQASPGEQGEVATCVGSEWYRYPSSFFLPSPRHRLHFVKSGFSGLLPRAFDPAEVCAACAHAEQGMRICRHGNRTLLDDGAYSAVPRREALWPNW